MDSTRDKKLLAKANTTKKGLSNRPHYELHTQSSLLKRKEPKECSTINLKRLKKFEGSRICKRRSEVVKQSKSMQALKTILMQEKDSCEIFGSLPNKFMKTAHSSKDYSENSFTSFQSDSNRSVLYDLVQLSKCSTSSEAKVNFQDEIGEHLEKSHASFWDDQISKYSSDIQYVTVNSLTSASLQDNCTKNAIASIEDRPFVKTRLQSSADESEDSSYENKTHHILRFPGKPENGPLDEEHSIEAQICQHSMPPNVTCRNRVWETWTSKRATIQSRDVADMDRSCDFDLEDIGTTKFVKQVDDIQPVMNDIRMSNQGKYAGRNLVSNLPVEVNKASTVESTTSLTQKSIASRNNQQRSKHSSVVESLNSESTRVLKSRKRSKLPIKENRDSCIGRTNHALKLREHLIGTRQTLYTEQRRISNRGMLLKKRSMTKVVCFPSSNSTSVSGKRNDTKLRSSRSKSISRHWQSRSTTSKNSSQNRQDIDNDHMTSYNKRSRPSKVMYALREIINSSRNNEDVGENTEVSENEKDMNSICTVGTQTMPYDTFCKHAETSCNLIDSTSSKTVVDPSAIRDELVSKDISIHTIVGPRPVEHAKTDDESECSDVTERLSISERDKALIGDSTELESRTSTETTTTSAETIDTKHVFATKTKIIMVKDEVHEDEIPLKLLENHGVSMRIVADEYEESTKHLDDYDIIGDSANNPFSKKSCWAPLSFYDYDASCSGSSEEATEDLEDDVRYEDTVAPKLGVNSIPSDVLVAFQIATEYARNLHKAVLLYNESLRSQESERQSKVVSENRGMSMLGDDRCCIQRDASFLSCISNDRSKSEHDKEYRLIKTSDEEFDKFSARSSSSKDSLHSHQLGLQNFEAHWVSYPEINLEEENAAPPQDVKTSMKLVQKCSDFMLVDMKSFVQLLVHRTQEEHALEVLKLGELAEDVKLQDGEKANGTVVSSAIEFVLVMSREHLVSLICCLLCTLVFWCLQFLFT